MAQHAKIKIPRQLQTPPAVEGILGYKDAEKTLPRTAQEVEDEIKQRTDLSSQVGGS